MGEGDNRESGETGEQDFVVIQARDDGNSSDQREKRKWRERKDLGSGQQTFSAFVREETLFLTRLTGKVFPKPWLCMVTSKQTWELKSCFISMKIRG